MKGQKKKHPIQPFYSLSIMERGLGGEVYHGGIQGVRYIMDGVGM